jgi:hypothetical protein
MDVSANVAPPPTHAFLIKWHAQPDSMFRAGDLERFVRDVER